MNRSLRISRVLVLVPVALLAACSDAGVGDETPNAGNETAPGGTSSTPEDNSPAPLPSAKATQIAMGSQHACAIVQDGTVRCWGAYEHGETGTGSPLGTEPDRYNHRFWLPVLVPGVTAKSISARTNHTCVVTTQGGAKCWGEDDFGQLGTGATRTDNSAAASAVPVDVKGLGSGVVAISAGSDSTCAVLATGGIKCWGHDEYGKLGNASPKTGGDSLPDAVSTPVDVVGITDAVQVSVGRYHACAVTNAGKAFCWGTNMNGELGIGKDDGSELKGVPNEVAALGTDVASITAGFGATCAVLKNGAAKCWGSGDDGALDDGKDGIIRNVSAPTDVIGLGPGAGVTQMSGPRTMTCAVANGAVKCWGKGGALGLAQGRAYETFQPNGNVVGLDANMAQVAIGYQCACALTKDGAVKCWGDAYSGVIGHGFNPDQTAGGWEETPVSVVSLP